MDQETTQKRSVRARISSTWQTAKLWLIFIGGLIAATVIISLPSQGESTYLIEEGDVVQQDILAPYALAYPSEILTEQARNAAADAIPNYYDLPNTQISRDQIEKLRTALAYIDTNVREDQFSSIDEKLSDLENIRDIQLDSGIAESIVLMPQDRWDIAKLEALTVLEQVMRREIREGRIEEAKRSIPTLISITLSDEDAEVVTNLVGPLVAANALFNEEATLAARDQARASVSPIPKTYEAGEIIIPRNVVANASQIEALQAYGLLQPPDRLDEIAINTLYVTLLGSCTALYLFRVHQDSTQRSGLVLLITILLVLSVLGMKLGIPGRTVQPYILPYATLPMLFAVLLGPGMGIITAVITGALAGYLATYGFEVALYAMLAGVLGALMIGKAERLSTGFWAGLAAALAAIAVIVVFRFPDPGTDNLGKGTLVLVALISGLLSASLAYGLLLLTSNLLGLTTSLQLIELSRPDHPLLQYLLHNAPGTYQHSLQVANLAEQAARGIGANAVLTRVGALYHDVGKAIRPQFFIENQIPGQNAHDQLDPQTSASMIISHVKDGLDLAKKYRLPASIRDFIAQHHGTMRTRYQYQAALEAAGEHKDSVNLKDFTYPGPRPRSREVAILLLADGVEAKARSDLPENDEEIDALVRWVIEDRLAQKQLDRTDLTLVDLDEVRKSFCNTINSIYHPRIRYPVAESDDEDEPEDHNLIVPTHPTSSSE